MTGIIQITVAGAISMLDRNCRQFTYRDVIMHMEILEKKLIERIQEIEPELTMVRSDSTTKIELIGKSQLIGGQE